MTGPLAGVRVLDLGHAGVGPYAAETMAQLGADVIKCEPPWGDIINKSGGVQDGTPSPLYLGGNLGKRCIHLNVKEPADRELFFALVSTADVYMENMRADAAERMGIGYEVLAAVNPRLVFVNSSGFGAKGPLRSVGSFEQYSDAFAGVSSVTGEADGRAERLPGLRVDPFTACCLVNMVLAGLLHRERTGKGQKIVGSQFESALQLVLVRAVELNAGTVPGPMGSSHPHVAPSGAFAAIDGHIAVAAETERQWRDLCIVIGRPELMFDPRFRTNDQRVEHRTSLVEELAPYFAARRVQVCMDELQARRVPAGAFQTQAQHHDDPQVSAAGMLQVAQTPWGPIHVPMMTGRFSVTPTSLGSGIRPGEHTEQITREIGVDPRPEAAR